MPLTEASCGVLYLCLIPSNNSVNARILKLEARLEGKRFFAWIEQPRKIVRSSRPAQNGLRSQGDQLILHDRVLPTQTLESALEGFLNFIWETPKAILLVTHSSGFELKLFFKALHQTNMVDKFGPAIEGILDTEPIFAEKISCLKDKSLFELPILVPSDQGGNFFDTSSRLKNLEAWVTRSIPTSELIQKSESYQTAVSRFLSPRRMVTESYVERFDDLKIFQKIVHRSVLNKLKAAGFTYSTLKELFQQMHPMELYKYMNKRGKEVSNSTFTFDIVLKIFDFFAKDKLHH